MLELTAKETDVELNPPSEQRSEYQQWHIEFVKGLGGRIFKIISKKNGKALQMSGDEVKMADCDNQNLEQHWIKKECFLLPQEQLLDGCIKVISTKKKRNCTCISIETKSHSLTHKPELCFEIQNNVAVESYF